MSADPVRLGDPPQPGQIVDFPEADVVAWAGADGTVTVCDARCPHQWSHFASEGLVVGNDLVCLTHLWRFDSSGAGWKEAMNGRRDEKAPVEVFRNEIRDGQLYIWRDT